jgi:hypothetical protein
VTAKWLKYRRKWVHFQIAVTGGVPFTKFGEVHHLWPAYCEDLEVATVTVFLVDSRDLFWYFFPYFAIISIILGIISSFVGGIGDLLHRRRSNRERVETAAAADGAEGAAREIEKLREESERRRKQVQDAILLGIAGETKSERVKFWLFAVFVAIAVLLAVTR